MNINKKLAVIIPVHEALTEDTQKLLDQAINSVLEQNGTQPGHLLIVGPKEVVLNLPHSIFETTGIEVKTVENTGNTNFQGQVNAAVAALPTEVEHFTVLEFDDTLRPLYGHYAAQHAELEPDTAVFLPLVEEVNAQGQLLKYSNEVLWTPSFSENLGLLDYEALQGYANFHLTGALIKKSAFITLGGLKESMELTFNYEFLLRVAQRDLVIASIPRVIYTHLDARDGSLFKSYTDGRTALTSEEVRFWFDTAHKECVFTEDRKVSYSPTAGE